MAPSRSVTTTSAVARASRPATGTSPGSPGPLPTSTTRPRRLRRRRRSTAPDSTWRRQRVAHRRDPARVGVARRDDAEREVAVRARRRHPGRAVAAVGGVDAPRAPLARHHRATSALSGRVGGGRHHEPGALEVADLPRPARTHLDVAVAGHPPRVVRRGSGRRARRAHRPRPAAGPGACRPRRRRRRATRRPARSSPTRVVTQGPMRSMVTRPSSTLTAYTAKSGPRPGSGNLVDRVQAAAVREREHLLVDRRRDRRHVPARAGDAARDHGRPGERADVLTRRTPARRRGGRWRPARRRRERRPPARG